LFGKEIFEIFYFRPAMLRSATIKPSLKARGTLRDVAQLVGVSHTTVSNAFSRPDQLSLELRAKIMDAARSVNYPGPNPAARMLTRGFANTIAIVYADPLYHAFEDPATSAFVGGVAEGCDKRGLGLLLLQGGGASLRTVQSAAVDGLIIYSMSKEGEAIRMIADRGLPMVVVDQPLIPKVPFVGIDDRKAARACAQHLKDLGHQNFGIVTFQLGTDGHNGRIERKRLKGICFEIPKRRIEGYLEVIEENGEGSSFMIWECSRSNEESGRTAGENILRSQPRPTAILATSDRLAIGVIEAARHHQLRVPEDLAVVGFDDIPAAKLITPALTTVHQPMADKGRLAVASLLRENRLLRMKVPTKLIIRQSTDPHYMRAGVQEYRSCRSSGV
jgi:DNA-binding LacI/PurR family transcriptional regulator